MSLPATRRFLDAVSVAPLTDSILTGRPHRLASLAGLTGWPHRLASLLFLCPDRAFPCKCCFFLPHLLKTILCSHVSVSARASLTNPCKIAAPDTLDPSSPNLFLFLSLIVTYFIFTFKNVPSFLECKLLEGKDLSFLFIYCNSPWHIFNGYPKNIPCI